MFPCLQCIKKRKIRVAIISIIVVMLGIDVSDLARIIRQYRIESYPCHDALSFLRYWLHQDILCFPTLSTKIFATCFLRKWMSTKFTKLLRPLLKKANWWTNTVIWSKFFSSLIFTHNCIRWPPKQINSSFCKKKFNLNYPQAFL